VPARKTTHGGARPGAGRKRLAPDGQARSPATVWLSPAEREHCRQLAGGVSAAVRQLIARSMGR
jgi:hypothetical protein